MTGLVTLISTLVIIHGCLLMYGFRRYAPIIKGNITEHLGAAVFFFALQIAGRSMWWDWFGGFGLGNNSNIIWNPIAIYAMWHCLKAVHLLIPESERHNYSTLTSVFYPYKLWRKIEDKDKE